MVRPVVSVLCLASVLVLAACGDDLRGETTAATGVASIATLGPTSNTASTADEPTTAGGYEVARVSVPDGVHVFDGGDSPFGVIIVGYDDYDSYAYLGGTGTGKINPNPPG